ncbi:substrate-binding domain-containing protein [Paraburkholderia sp. ZP32-5]|uniref:substrate-binding domain-containing protein n=1 Tax=Paraburkholderia sp. ZP32-5 TaxID=2883245 RepID=UPI001F380745|nr:substrate-binding domain-containing protein [Paraburkholderia sp. ZP32-5]
MKSNQRKICQALALLISAMGASAAMAGPLVQGGGSSLVAPTIGLTASTLNEIGLFGTTEATLTYYSVGSGAGQTAFLNNLPASFGAGVTGTVDFANSDAALTTAQITGYTRTATDGPLIQIPYIVTPITISLANGPAVTSTTTPQTNPNQSHSIALNDADLCGIFSGNFTNWNQVTNPETGAKYAASTITVVYRTDASGTNELLTRHLANVCPNVTPTTTKTGVTFVDSLALGDSFPGHTVPTSFVGVSNSAGVRNALLAAISTSSGAPALVAYLSPDYTNTFLAPKSTVVTTTGAVQLSVASLQNSAATGAPIVAPTAANASAAVATMTLPTNPADQTQWVPTSGSAYTALANPTAGYPISGTSQIILSQCYKDATVGQAMHDFLNDHFTSASFISVVQGNGFNTLPSAFTTAVVSDFLVGTKANLNINNSTICSGKGR